MTTDPQHRAGAAKRELDETGAAFDALRVAMVDALTGLTPTDTANMQALVCGIQSLDAVRKALQAVIDNGRIEDAADELKARLKVA